MGNFNDGQVNSSHATGFEALSDSEALQHLLESHYPASAGNRIIVAAHSAAGAGYAAINDASARLEILPGCLTKLLTGTLLRRMAYARGLSLDSSMLAVLGDSSPSLRAIPAALTFRHLLDHCHGLDATDRRVVPQLPSGFLDADTLLCGVQRARRLGAPGEVCSYDDTGAWLSALVLERTNGQRLADQLGEVVPLWNGAGQCQSPWSGVCAATGGTLSMPVHSLLAFLRAQMQPGPMGLLGEGGLTAIESSLRPRAGWSALDLGLYLGWVYYGSGWLGHNSIVPAAPAMARINPTRGLALIVCTDGINPTTVAARLMGKLAPELFRINMPRALKEPQLIGAALDTLEGRYGNGRVLFELARDGTAIAVSAYMIVAGSRSRAPFARASFVPGYQNVIIPRPAHPHLPQFFQLILPEQDRFRFLWDGKSAFRRIPDS